MILMNMISEEQLQGELERLQSVVETLRADLAKHRSEQQISDYSRQLYEAITERSVLDNGHCLVHPDELHVLLRRLIDTDGEDLRSCILYTLGIEEV